MTYRPPSNAAPTAALLLSEEQLAEREAAMHETMRAEGGRLIRARDRAYRLMLGRDEFAAAWSDDGYTGGPIDVMSDTIASACNVSGMSPFPVDTVHSFLMRIAELDTKHPLVAHRNVLRAACQGMDQFEHDWSDLDYFVGSKDLFDAGPSIGQPCRFIASDESQHDATVTHVWGPTMVNLEFGGGQQAPSVRVVRQVEPGARYVCTLRPMVAATEVAAAAQPAASGNILDAIADLAQALSDAGNAPAEVTAALDRVKALAQGN